MSGPLSHHDLRRRNLSLLLGTLLRQEEATRKEIERETGLSKATVSRLVDELLQAGAVVASPTTPADPSVRGRRADTLRAPSTLGVVAGVSLGIRTTSIFVTDLVGRELAWRQLPTRKWDDFGQAVDWAVEVTRSAVDELGGPLQHVVVALPARALDGAVVTRPPLFMASIEGDAFARVLAERLACPVRLELDATSVLAGFEALGFVEADASPVLLNLGSVLTMALQRRDGSIARGASASFGDFSLIPVETGLGASRVGTLLGAHGLYEASQRLGSPLEAMEQLWESDVELGGRLREAFAEALDRAIRTVIVMADPGLIIFTGRLAPLVRLSLPGISAALERDIGAVPELRIVEHAENDYPAAVGAAREARAEAVAQLLDRVSAEGLGPLSGMSTDSV